MPKGSCSDIVDVFKSAHRYRNWCTPQSPDGTLPLVGPVTVIDLLGNDIIGRIVTKWRRVLKLSGLAIEQSTQPPKAVRAR